MAISVGGQSPGDMGPPFRKRQIRHNSAQGFKHGAPYDVRSGFHSPLVLNDKIVLGKTEERIEAKGSGVVRVWKRSEKEEDNEQQPKKTKERIRVFLDWMGEGNFIPEDTEVVCYYFEDEKLWRAFALTVQAVKLERCSDQKTIFAFNSFISDDLGHLSDNIGAVVRLEESSLLEETCWTILEAVDCTPEICPTVCAIYETCEECNGCWRLVRCGDAGDSKVIKQENVCDVGQVLQEGDVVLLDDDICYIVAKAYECDGHEDVVIISKVEECDKCQQCIVLKGCWDDSLKVIHADQHDLEVNEVFKINGCCFRVIRKEACNDLTGEEADAPRERIPEIKKKYDRCHDCGCYELVSCDGEGNLTADCAIDVDGDPLDLSTLIGKIVLLEGGGCYEVEEANESCGSSSPVVILESYRGCSDCHSWELTPCPGEGGPVITTYSDLSEEWADGRHVIRRLGDGKCYTITGQPEFDPTDVETTVEESYDGPCTDCTAPKYAMKSLCPSCDDELTASDCEYTAGGNVAQIAGGGTDVVTDEDLSDSVGQYIKYEKVCYFVEQTDSGEAVTLASGFTYSGPYQDCESCQKTCLWLVHDVYDGTTVIGQKKTKILVDRICEEDDLDVIDIEDC